jgi:CBS domain containing-hemolysin-like protein
MKMVLEFLAGVFIILFCILCESFFSGTETAFVSLDRAKIKALADKGDKGAIGINSFLEKPESFFSTTLLGTNLSVVISNTIATIMVITYLGERYEYITIFIMAPLLLVFGEIVPKTVYRYHADQIAPHLVAPLKVIAGIFKPFVSLLSEITECFVKFFRMDRAQTYPLTTREDLANYLDLWNINSRLKTAEKKMVERIFDFSETLASDIMIPLVNIKALEDNDSIEEAIIKARRTGHSRIPVYSEKAYNIIGIVLAYDLITVQDKSLSIKDILRPARYVPDSIPVDKLLKQLRTEGNSIAIVVDEYGGTTGIVTVEDILEEVVGEIYDEHDKEETSIIRTGENRYLIDALTEIERLNEHFKIQLPKEDYETVSGFLLKKMGKIPETAETFKFGDITFIIKETDIRSIKKVIIVLPEPKKEKPTA